MHAVYEPPLWITQETSRANPDFHHGLLVEKRVLQVRFGNALDPVVLIVPRITCGECDINLDNRALLVHVLLRAYLKSTVLFKNSEQVPSRHSGFDCLNRCERL